MTRQVVEIAYGGPVRTSDPPTAQDATESWPGMDPGHRPDRGIRLPVHKPLFMDGFSLRWNRPAAAECLLVKGNLPKWLTPVKYVARARVENVSVEIPSPEVRR